MAICSCLGCVTAQGSRRRVWCMPCRCTRCGLDARLGAQAQQEARRMWTLNQRRTQQDGPGLPDAPPYRAWFQNVSGLEPPSKSASHLKKDVPQLRYRHASC